MGGRRPLMGGDFKDSKRTQGTGVTGDKSAHQKKWGRPNGVGKV